ncbi:MAG TPA: recombinase family protein [Lacunisphaera sp.]|nr:recombinase family protein [Lacunisphaera sp.]
MSSENFSLTKPHSNRPAYTPVAIYARVSTENQLGFRFDSCSHQVQTCRDFLKQMAEQGWFEAGCYVDEAYSGATMDRPGIQTLCDAIATGRIKVVLIYRLERILRSTYEWAKFSRFLEKHGCRLVTPNEDHSDFSAAGRFRTNMLVNISEYERQNTAEKTTAKMRAQAARGFWSGGFIPFGYAYDRQMQQLRREPTESTVVKKIFERAAQLVPLGEIATALNAAGHRTAQRWARDADRNRRIIGGKPFRTDVLRKLIQNPIYRGVVRFREEEYPGQHEALVTPEVWERANATIAEAKRRPNVRLRPRDKYQNLLKGIVACARCDNLLYSRAGGKDTPEGKAYRYYACKRAKAPGCSLHIVPATRMEELVVGFLAHSSTPDCAVERFAKISTDSGRGKELTAKIASIDATLETLAQRHRNCVEAVAQRGLPGLNDGLREKVSVIRSERQPLWVRKAQLQYELETIDAGSLDRERVRHAFQRLGRLLTNATDANKRRLLQEILVQVALDRVGRDEFTATFQIGSIALVAAMEREVAIDDRTIKAPPSFRARSWSLTASFRVPKRGPIEILEPFAGSIARPSVPPPPPPVAKARHPIHRADAWDFTIAKGQSVRAIARTEGVSPSTVSFHLKLLTLAPEIQDFARDLKELPAIERFSLRKLAQLSVHDVAEQRRRFRLMRQRFDQGAN